MKKSVTIELDKARNLRYGINALVRIEELLGKPITALDLNNLSIADIRDIVFAGLVHEDKDLTSEKVGDLIDEYSNLTVVSDKIGEAFTLAFGEGKSGKNAVSPQVKVGG